VASGVTFHIFKLISLLIETPHHMPHDHLCTISVRHVSIKVQPCSFNGLRDHFKKQKIL